MVIGGAVGKGSKGGGVAGDMDGGFFIYFLFFYFFFKYTTTHGTVTYITYITYRRKKNYLQINYLHFSMGQLLT